MGIRVSDSDSGRVVCVWVFRVSRNRIRSGIFLGSGSGIFSGSGRVSGIYSISELFCGYPEYLKTRNNTQIPEIPKIIPEYPKYPNIFAWEGIKLGTLGIRVPVRVSGIPGTRTLNIIHTHRVFYSYPNFSGSGILVRIPGSISGIGYFAQPYSTVYYQKKWVVWSPTATSSCKIN